MEHLFWLEPSIAGRPGPDKEAWDLDYLCEQGVAAILSVNDGEMVHVSRLHELGIAYALYPLSDSVPPREGDSEQCLNLLPDVARFIQRHKNNGTVIVHCHSGKDRTALALAAYCMKSTGCTPREAMAMIKASRCTAFSAPGWNEFSLRVLEALYDDFTSAHSPLWE